MLAAVPQLIVLLGQMREVGAEEIKSGWGSLIFMGCFILAVILVGIWWLRRG
jgi:hypothetical protein